MSKQALRANVYGIKCDATGCDFIDDSVRFEDYGEWLNRPCPKCGANLLTEADLAATKALLAMTDWFNAITEVPEDAEPSDGSGPLLRAHMNGTGKVDFEIVGGRETET